MARLRPIAFGVGLFLMVCAGSGLASLIAFSDLSSTPAILTGTQLTITCETIGLDAPDWVQVNLELRNVGFSSIQLQGIKRDCGLSSINRMPSSIAPFSSKTLTCAVSAEKLRAPLVVPLFIDGAPVAVAVDVPSELVPNAPEAIIPPDFSSTVSILEME